MALFRRREARLEPELVDGTQLVEALGPTFLQDLDALCERMAAVDERLAALEARLTVAERAADMVPEHGDVLDVEVRAARLAADLHLVRLEVDRLRRNGGVDLRDRG